MKQSSSVLLHLDRLLLHEFLLEKANDVMRRRSAVGLTDLFFVLLSLVQYFFLEEEFVVPDAG